ncbi:YcnI family protein [Nocardioides albidus]|uniref:YcnI family protein n=1 Tax=Nocardioides albidus TaxID=1517589 RepID=A0A5C4W3I2_9ACTN|nr:YcnI family protein [Nocardioides albidus]TNM42758.1 YcnI family protein [Nocardioides albidus]
MHIRRFTLPTLGAAALGIVALTAGAAGAHVSVSPDTTAAGSYAVLTFSVPHGCEGSPTTKVAIQLPADVPQVTPTVNPNWTVEKVTEKLAEPLQDSHGNEITERVSQVVYTARTPLEDGFRDTLALSLQLPEKAGETLTFPVLQTCARGETAWNETPAEGQDEEELENPAPAVTITEAGAGGHHGAADAAEEPGARKDGDDEDGDDEAGDDGNGLAVAGLVAGLGGLVLGGLALARSGRKA